METWQKCFYIVHLTLFLYLLWIMIGLVVLGSTTAYDNYIDSMSKEEFHHYLEENPSGFCVTAKELTIWPYTFYYWHSNTKMN